MKTLTTFIFILITLLKVQAGITLYPKTSVSLNGNLHLSVRNMDLMASTSAKIDSAVTIALYSSADKQFEVTGDSLIFGNLKIGGNYSLTAYSKVVSIAGNITMTGNGILDVAGNNILLGGKIEGESNDCYITGSTGSLIKKLPPLPQETTETGLGLSFSLLEQHNNTLEVQRIFEPSINKDKESIRRLYRFSEPLTLGNIDFSYLLSELNDVADPVLCVYAQEKGSWDMVLSPQHNHSRQAIAGQPTSKVEQVSIFSYPELSFPLYFTPNGDGINDIYAIEGIERYENTVFIVLDNTGKQVFSASPYKNDFNGYNLKDGTYYFIFKRAATDKTPYKRGTFEILR